MTRRYLIAIATLLLLTINSASAQVLSGIDVLVRDQFKVLQGAKAGLITNQTGADFNGTSTVQHFRQADNLQLVALFSPEHGFEGKLDQASIGDATDKGSGLKIHSLYGATRVPTAQMLEGIDTLVFDIQDIGSRFYTYISTMGGAMRAASDHDVHFVVLDRPNPINGVTVQGPTVDQGSESFVAYHNVAIRHGMTVGELATMFRTELELELDLTVIEMEGWEREMMFDATGRLWINPSPNMRSLTQALLYPGVGLLETTNLSVGRGTDTPFEVIGAPWIDAVQLADSLNHQRLPGIRFVAIRFRPDSSKFANEPCGGVQLIVTDRNTFDSLGTGLTLALTLRDLYHDAWDTSSLNRLLVNRRCLEGIRSGLTLESLEQGYSSDLNSFMTRRSRFLLYR